MSTPRRTPLTQSSIPSRTGALSAEDVLAWVAERVAPHKRLGAVEFIEAVPTSPSGKTLRRLLRAHP